MRNATGGWMRVAGVLLAVLWDGPVALAACPPHGYERDTLLALEKAQFALADDRARQALALGLLDCLADPDSLLRDAVAFDALARWMREDRLEELTRRQLMDTLLPRLAAPDPTGVAAPFAALVLSEVARTDRIEPWLDAAERATLVDAAASFLAGVRDYRGFDARDGWRHGVAHGADFALQLALNPALDRAALDRLLAVVATQVAPAGEHFYVYGEPARLMAPVLYIGKRGLHSPQEWRSWFAKIAAPAPLPDWQQAFTSQAGLAKRHNTTAFLLALYLSLREGNDPDVAERMLPGLLEAIRAVP